VTMSSTGLKTLCLLVMATCGITPTYDAVGSVTFSHTVVNFLANIGLTDYLIAFEDDGSCEYINTDYKC